MPAFDWARAALMVLGWAMALVLIEVWLAWRRG